MKNIVILSLTYMFILFFTVLNTGCNEELDTPTLETGTVTDIDGNIYKTVKIGSRWWMAENLKVQRYRNQDSIVFISKNTSDSTWAKLDEGAVCSFSETYGLLYNFYAIADERKITPEGWHIPSDEEWKELEMYLGMDKVEADKINWRGTNEGNKLKTAGNDPVHWAEPADEFEVYGTNENGFSAIGCASRIFNGKWGDLTRNAFWWSSTNVENEVWYRGLDYNKPNVFRYLGSKNYGFSVRCVKD